MGRIQRGQVDMPPIHKGLFGGENWEWHALRDMPWERLVGDVAARLGGASHEASHSLLQSGEVSIRIYNPVRNHVLFQRVRLQVGHGLRKIQRIGRRAREGPPGVLGQLLQLFLLRGPPHRVKLEKDTIFYKLTQVPMMPLQNSHKARAHSKENKEGIVGRIARIP
jgi:hypothetical protein